MARSYDPNLVTANDQYSTFQKMGAGLNSSIKRTEELGAGLV